MYTLRQARRFREKTQQEMADALDVSRTTYIDMELHPGRITMNQVKIICDFLNMKTEDIIFEE